MSNLFSSVLRQTAATLHGHFLASCCKNCLKCYKNKKPMMGFFYTAALKAVKESLRNPYSVYVLHYIKGANL